jgi:hypothetical protein
MHLPALQLPDLSVSHHRLRSIHRARWLAYLMGGILEPQVADLPLSFRSLDAGFDSRLGYMSYRYVTITKYGRTGNLKIEGPRNGKYADVLMSPQQLRTHAATMLALADKIEAEERLAIAEHILRNERL